MTTFFDPRTKQKRAFALDALRGLSILLMVFSGVIPFGVLPDWMYHAQVPPPNHVFNPSLPGITWVDLVFPFFLFTMGAAIPLALTRRIEKGVPFWKLSLSSLERGVLLAAFALFVMQIRPYQISDTPTPLVWLAGFAGFLLLIPMMARLPEKWDPWLKYLVRGTGWAGAAVFMVLVRFKDGSGFSLYRSDIIILVLANMAVFTAFFWLATRKSMLVRLGILALLLASRASSIDPGWTNWLWLTKPVPWLFQFHFLKYLFITIPGTIVGDMILGWMNTSEAKEDRAGAWRTPRLVVTAALMILFDVVLVIGLKNRLVWETTLAAAGLCIIGWQLIMNPRNSTERFLADLFRWGTFYLLLGLLFEPFEGGIKKDPSSLSYYFVTSGLAIFTLIALTIAIDILKKRRGFMFLIESGQNPMVAYCGVQNLIPPILGLTHLDQLLQSITPTPWLGALRGAFVTFLVALGASIFTKRKIFLRT